MYYYNIIYWWFIEFQETNKIGLNKNFITQGYNLKIMLKARKKNKNSLFATDLNIYYRILR